MTNHALNPIVEVSGLRKDVCAVEPLLAVFAAALTAISIRVFSRSAVG